MFMTDIIIDLDKVLPPSLTLSETFLFIFMFSLAVLCITLFARFILGKNSSLKHSLVAALGIIILYAFCVVIYTVNPAGLNRYLAPLPFVFFEENELVLFNFATADFPTICVQLLSMVVLAYLVNQINCIPVTNTKPLGWFVFRVLCILASIVLHYMLHRVMLRILGDCPPQVLMEYAPMILLGILVFMFLLGFVKFIIGLFLTVMNPLFGGIYTFFFVNKIGKNISRAIGSTAALTVFICVLHDLGYHSLPISADSLDQYIPFIACISLLWIIVGSKF